ncbi:MAG: hypothetical protein GY757_50835 [bacterium]|nr:hypothetical protein [bacterium]
MNLLISLKCPGCGANLSGENSSKIFFCFTCSNAFNVGENKLSRYPLVYTKPGKEKPGEMEYFPFWRLESSYNALADSRVVGGGKYIFYIPGFFIKNINYFGDIGFYYLKKGVSPQPGPRKKAGVFTAERSLAKAAVYPGIYIKKMETQKSGAAPHDIEVIHHTASVFLIPFYKEDHFFYDSYLDWKYPSGALN